MPGQFTTDSKIRYKNVLENPHIVDWYFSHRLNEFLKVVEDWLGIISHISFVFSFWYKNTMIYLLTYFFLAKRKIGESPSFRLQRSPEMH